MNEYKVTWEIDIDAENPFEAAKAAGAIQRDANTTATIFRVAQMPSAVANTVVVPGTKTYYETDVITCAAYFYERLAVSEWPDDVRDSCGGHIGVVTDYASIPVLLAKLCYAGSEILKLEFPGVYEYEVAEEVGVKAKEHLDKNGKEPSLADVEQWAADKAFVFFMQGTNDYFVLASMLADVVKEHRKK